VKGPNPTHGSGWIVQVLPTICEAPVPVVILFLADARKRDEKNNNGKGASVLFCRLDLKYPPTAVGGICIFSNGLFLGGIFDFFTPSDEVGMKLWIYS